MKLRTLASAATVCAVLYGAGNAEAQLVLPDPTTAAYQYGDAYSYSLPILANYYSVNFGGGVGPGNPYYVASSNVANFVVVGTGSNGNPETTNTPIPIATAGLMDNAYRTPSGNGGSPTFDMSTLPDPGGYNGTDKLWTTTISALMGYVGTGKVPIFLFNNNQTNSGSSTDQQLLIWGQIAISGTGKTTKYFDLSNNGNTANNGGGFVSQNGIPGPFSNVGLYSNPTGLGPAFGGYVISGGEVCVDAGGNVVACNSPLKVKTINHNLGDNQAAYAAIFPELNAILTSPNFGGYTDMTLNVKMLDLNSGGETIFIEGGTVGGGIVPEPSTFVLLGAGLAGLGWFGRRKLQK